MDKLTPTQHDILTALQAGPATTDQLAERTGRRHHVLAKALNGLAGSGHVATVEGTDETGDAAWELAPPASAGTDDTSADETSAPPEEAGTAEEPALGDGQVEPARQEEDLPGAEPTPGDPASADSGPAEASEVKVCRGCQAQMPVVCPACARTTPSYCAACRTTRAQGRGGRSGDPEILLSGLPKLRPGELRQLVLGVLTSNPLPEHRGIVGWTPGRVAIFLPGRSTGAIGESLDRLVATGVAELISDSPRRYELANPEPADTAPTEPERASEEPDQGPG